MDFGFITLILPLTYTMTPAIINHKGGSMTIGIVATFSISALLFVMSYVARDEGYLGLAFLGIGIVLAAAGIYLAASKRQ